MQFQMIILFFCLLIKMATSVSYSLLFAGGISNPSYFISDAVIDNNGGVAYCVGQQTSSIKGALLIYDISFASPILLNTCLYPVSNSNLKQIYLVNSTTVLCIDNNNIGVLFSLTTCSYIGQTKAVNISSALIIPSTLTLVYTTTTNFVYSISLTTLSATPVLLANDTMLRIFLSSDGAYLGITSYRLNSTLSNFTLLNAQTMAQIYFFTPQKIINTCTFARNDTLIQCFGPLLVYIFNCTVKSSTSLINTVNVLVPVSSLIPLNALYDRIDDVVLFYVGIASNLYTLNLSNAAETLLFPVFSSSSKMASFINQKYLVFGVGVGNVLIYENQNGSPICTSNQYLTAAGCSPCSTSCVSCTNGTNCVSCVSGTNLISGYCCQPNQFFLNPAAGCKNCSTNCYACTGIGSCSTCATSYSLMSGYCCLNNQFYSGGCQNCSDNCTLCTGIGSCTTCAASYQKMSGYCCLSNQYYSAGCKFCSLNCASCTFVTLCGTCMTNYFLRSGYCCLSNQFYLSGVGCQNCSSNCNLCTNASFCTACATNYYNMSNFCCLSNQYYLSGCQNCFNGCNTCLGIYNCSNCSSGFQLLTGICCLLSQFQLNHTCINCSSNCLRCTGLGKCSVCAQNFTLSYGYCCHSNQFYDRTASKCVDCSQGCAICTSSSNCFKLTSTNPQAIFCEQYVIQHNRTTCASWQSNQFVGVMTESLTYLISTPYLNQIVVVLSPLFIFSDDYWFYIYHNRTYKNLVVTVTFFQIMEEINSLRFLPQIINVSSIQQAFNFNRFFTSDYSNYSFPTISFVEGGSQAYFIINIQDLITWNYLFNFVIFAICNIIWCFINVKIEEDRPCRKLIREIQKLIRNQAHKSSLIIGLVETNLIILVFYSVQQIQRGCFFLITDKINVILSLLFFFAAIIYSFCFYILFYQFQRKFTAKLIESPPQKQFNFIYQAPRKTLKSFIMATIHSGFLKIYSLQILLLLSTKVMIIVFIITYRSRFQSLASYVLAIGYESLGIIFDIMLILTYYCYERGYFKEYTINLSYHSYVQLAILIGIFSCVLLLIVVLIVNSIRQSCCKSSKVSDEPNEQKLEQSKKAGTRQLYFKRKSANQTNNIFHRRQLIQQAHFQDPIRHKQPKITFKIKKNDQIQEKQKIQIENQIPQENHQQERQRHTKQKHTYQYFKRQKTFHLKILTKEMQQMPQ